MNTDEHGFLTGESRGEETTKFQAPMPWQAATTDAFFSPQIFLPKPCLPQLSPLPPVNQSPFLSPSVTREKEFFVFYF
jgi:hypothetical protein